MTGKNIPGDIGTDQIPSGNCLWYYEGLTTTTTSTSVAPSPRSLYSSPFLASFFFAPRRRSYRTQERQQRQPASKPELAPQLPANPWTALLSTSCYLLVPSYGRRHHCRLRLLSRRDPRLALPLLLAEEGDVCKTLNIFFLSFLGEGSDWKTVDGFLNFWIDL